MCMRELLKSIMDADFLESNKTDEEIISIWRKLDLLDGVEGKDVQKNIAKSYARMAQKILTNEKHDNYVSLETISLPIVRAVILNGYKESIEDADLDFLYDIWKDIKIEEIIKESGVTNENGDIIIDNFGDYTCMELYTQEDKYNNELNIDVEAYLTWYISHYFGNKIKIME